jgi:hypothetical protein
MADINSYAMLVNNHGAGMVNPAVFYDKQLLDTIRLDANEYVYYRLADEMPIQEKADKLMVRRWAPLQGHTVPLAEGVPPVSDKGSVEKYEMTASQYGRYMEFSDYIDFKVVDSVVAHYTREYSLVIMETFDLLAKETLFSVANKYYAGGAINFEALTPLSIPNMTDLRLIVLSLKKALVKPRSNGRYHVLASPEFYFDMISDAVVEKYMTINQTTKTMYSDTKLVPMFDMEFYEAMTVPTSAEFVKTAVLNKRMYRWTGAVYEYANFPETFVYTAGGAAAVTTVSDYVHDARTGQHASYVPNQKVWAIAAWNADAATTGADYIEFKAQHVLVIGKDALVRTGLSGEGQAKMYVKAKGSAGVLDPIDQRQSIGFKINSVGFGTTRLEAVVDYVCVPTQVSLI